MSSSHLLANSTWNASAFLISAGLNFLVLPFALLQMGASVFGVAGLVTACIAPALAFSNALALSTTRELAQRLLPDQRDDARRLFAAALFLAVAGGLPIAFVFSFAGPQIARQVFNLNSEMNADLSRAFMFGAAGWLCQCGLMVFQSLFAARQDYARLSSINIVITAVSALSTFVLVRRWPQASTFLGCQAAGFAAGLFVSYVISRRTIGEWLARPALLREPLSRLINFGGWQFAAQSGGAFASQADRYLLGAFLAPQFVGYYTIAQRLEEAVYIGVLKIGEILFPFFSSMQEETGERIADLLFRSCWVLNLLAVSVLGALIPIAGPLLQAWTGNEVAAQTQVLLVVLSSAGILGCGSNVFSYYLLANGRSQSNAIIALVTALAMLLTSSVALFYFGWRGAGWSACAGMVAQIALTLVLLRQSFDLRDAWSRIAHLVLQPLATGIVTALALRYVTGHSLFDQAPHWWLVGSLYCTAAGIIFVVVATVSCLGPYGAVCWRDLTVIANRFLHVRVA